MKTKTNEEIGLEAAKIARKKILEIAKRVKLTPERTLQRIAEGLSATEIKAQYDKDRERWVYSRPLVDHGQRLSAAQLSILIHDMKPCERKKIEVNGRLSFNVAGAKQKLMDRIAAISKRKRTRTGGRGVK
jgi:uncharacterized protein (DUF1778 family)